MPTAITFSEYGGPEVLTLSEVATPEPGPGQVRIRVRATAVNPIDVRIRAGRMQGLFPVAFPMVPGWDVAGVVDKVGAGATASVGDQVFGPATCGGYSQYALLDQPLAKPKELSFETAAAMVTVGEAAYRAIKHLGVRSPPASSTSPSGMPIRSPKQPGPTRTSKPAATRARPSSFPDPSRSLGRGVRSARGPPTHSHAQTAAAP
ncbi:hypothetical protein HEK616_78670 (plasmid) [Streptomyces nigrescens]|uniref:Enoyl reductase (ER) domain-containing protein n=2 Tax=Streptomyces TaxID=1883 RepID=A0ABM8A6R2_STRNI|nr:alcohol dehydrogenase catalytic domain-containing protein [Streptomyces sp. DSM 41528]BDM74380.1 hypothetical protein HEK616_78670 [Streptomyces nigrescens]